VDEKRVVVNKHLNDFTIGESKKQSRVPRRCYNHPAQNDVLEQNTIKDVIGLSQDRKNMFTSKIIGGLRPEEQMLRFIEPQRKTWVASAWFSELFSEQVERE
jgi:hypothetical protein